MRLRGPGRGSLRAKRQKVSKKSRQSLSAPGPKSPKKVSKKGPKSQKKVLKMGFWRLFGRFSRLFLGLSGPRAGRLFRDFLVTFWLLAPRLPLPGPTEPQNCQRITSKFCQAHASQGPTLTHKFSRNWVRVGWPQPANTMGPKMITHTFFFWELISQLHSTSLHRAFWQ